jgi:hypothetical protein
MSRRDRGRKLLRDKFLAETAEIQLQVKRRNTDGGASNICATGLINRHLDNIYHKMSAGDKDRMLADNSVPAHVTWPPLLLPNLQAPEQKDAIAASSSSAQPSGSSARRRLKRKGPDTPGLLACSSKADQEREEEFENSADDDDDKPRHGPWTQVEATSIFPVREVHRRLVETAPEDVDPTVGAAVFLTHLNSVVTRRGRYERPWQNCRRNGWLSADSLLMSPSTSIRIICSSHKCNMLSMLLA